MQSRKPAPRTVPPVESKEQWDALVDSISSEGDVIIESRSGERAVIISYEEFLELLEQRKRKLREKTYAGLQKALKDQVECNANLSDEEVEKLAHRAGWEIREELNRKYRAGLLSFPNDDQE